MHKTTRLGIPASLLIALMFLAGLVEPTVMIGLVVYVFLIERDSRVKSAAQKALMLFVAYVVIRGALETLDHVVCILLKNEAEGIYKNIYWNLEHLVVVAKNAGCLVFGLTELLAFLGSGSRRIYVEPEVEGPAQQAAPTQQAAPVQQAAPAQQAAPVHQVAPAQQAAPVQQGNICPNCGNALDKGAHFCKKCGTRTN